MNSFDNLRTRYKEKYPSVDDETIELLCCQHKVIVLNSLFKNELEAFKASNTTRIDDPVTQQFRRRWGFCPIIRLYWLPGVDKPIAVSFPGHLRLGLDIDLRFPKKKIEEKFKAILDEHHRTEKELSNERKELEAKYKTPKIAALKGIDYNPYAQYAKKLPKDKPATNIAKRNQQKSEYIREVIEVYEAREGGASWSQAGKGDKQDARNKYKAAKRYIETGIKPFKAFPRKPPEK
jgi:hypothetical protein